jgi:hypothetical protein
MDASDDLVRPQLIATIAIRSASYMVVHHTLGAPYSLV